MSSGTRLLLMFSFAVMVVVGAVASLAVGSWWLLPLALLAHAAGTGVVLFATRMRLTEEDKPDPVTEARLAEEGNGSDPGPRIRTDPVHVRDPGR